MLPLFYKNKGTCVAKGEIDLNLGSSLELSRVTDSLELPLRHLHLDLGFLKLLTKQLAAE